MTPKGFRLDVQGIRGIGLIIVLATHAEVPFFNGGFVGLDLFYVLSGFLITGLIVTEIERRGTLSLLNFYARRVKRLLPAAVTVLLVTLALSTLLFTPVRQLETAGDVIAAGLYFINWRFISQQVDYFADTEGNFSPLQHYWSLSVEEQFYIVWPMALLAVSMWAFRSGWTIRRSIWLFIAPVGIASLIYSIIYTPLNPDAAYFSTLTRVWQLAAGGALMLVLPLGLRMPKWLSAALTVAGVGALLATTGLYTEDQPYPGWRAIVPVLGTMAVIVAGTAVAVSRPIWLLSQAPLQYLGKVSYSWYLWHWPAIVFAVEIFGNLTWPQKVAATLVGGIPATITHYTIEERFRRSKPLNRKPRTSLAIGFTFTIVALISAVAIRAADDSIPTAPDRAVAGAEVVEASDGTRTAARFQQQAEAIKPVPVNARDDRGQAFEDGCMVHAPETEPPDCVYGDEDSEVTVALLGDSHALQYAPTMIRLAEENGWRLETYMRAECVIALEVEYDEGCTEWLETSLERIEEAEPAMVVSATGTTSRYRVSIDGEELERRESQPYLVEGFKKTQQRLLETGAEVVLIRDQARSPFIVHDCVAESPDDLTMCAFEPQRLEQNLFDIQGVRDLHDVRVIDPMPIVCPDNLCHPVIGNALVYRDSYHFSATFARTLAPWLDRRLPNIPRPGAEGNPTRT